tara:strand:+ start:4625 stop:6823 length:2199 start_codon:yes stop_codon:yes gene_type:complete
MPVWTEDSGSTTNYLDKQVDLEPATTYRIKNSSSTDLFTISESTGAINMVGSVTFGAPLVNDLIGNVTGNLTGNITGNVTGNLTGNVTGNVTGDSTGDLTGNVTGNVVGNVTGNITSAGTSSFANIDINGGTIDGCTIFNNVTGDLTGDVTGSNWFGDLTVSGDLTVNGNDITFGGSQATDSSVDANLFFVRSQADAASPTLRIKSVNEPAGSVGTGLDLYSSDLTIETDGINTLKSYTHKELVGVKILHSPAQNPTYSAGGSYNAKVKIDAVSRGTLGEGVIFLGEDGGLHRIEIGNGVVANSPKMRWNGVGGGSFDIYNKSGRFSIDANIITNGNLNFDEAGFDPISTGQNSSNQYFINNNVDGAGTNMALFTTNLFRVSGDIRVGGNHIEASDGSYAITLSGSDVTSVGDLTVLGTGTSRVSGDLRVDGDFIVSVIASTTANAITLSGSNVNVVGDLNVLGDTTDLGLVNAGEWRGNAIADGYISSAATWNAKQNALTFGIANNNALLVDEPDGGYTATAGDIAQFTSTGIKGVDHVTAIGKDEDNMSSNSDTHFPTQQSVKSYVDAYNAVVLQKDYVFSETTSGRTYFKDIDDSTFNKWDAYDSDDSINVGNTIDVVGSNSIAGLTVPFACKLVGVYWLGYQGQNNDQNVYLQTWTTTISDNAASGGATFTLRDNQQVVNYNRKTYSRSNNGLSVNLSAGDMIIPAFRYESGTTVKHSGAVAYTLERQ